MPQRYSQTDKQADRWLAVAVPHDATQSVIINTPSCHARWKEQNEHCYSMVMLTTSSQNDNVDISPINDKIGLSHTR